MREYQGQKVKVSSYLLGFKLKDGGFQYRKVKDYWLKSKINLNFCNREGAENAEGAENSESSEDSEGAENAERSDFHRL